MGYPEKIDLIDCISLFDEIKKCKWKSELVDTFARYGIKDDTKRTVETKGTCKSGKSGDLYATFITVADNKKYKTHMQFLVGQIDIITVNMVSDDRYFSKYEVYNKTGDGCRNRCFKIPYDVDEFKYVMDYFLRYDENWLNRESETVIDTAEQEDVLKAQLDNSVDEIDKEIETKQLQGEEREALIKVRVNQSAFRKLLMRRYTHCCLCDVDDESLLVPSDAGKKFFYKGLSVPCMCQMHRRNHIIFLAPILFKKYKVPWQLCIIMAGIMLTDWSLQYFGIKESTNSRRFVTGLIGGFGLNTLKLKIL